jgi:hypothetical protein
MKSLFNPILIFTILFFGTLLYNNSAFSQCTNCGSQYPSGTYSTTSASWTTISPIIYGSEWHYENLSTGYIYQWRSNASGFDSQLTLYPSATCGGTSLAYNDDCTYNTGYTNDGMIAYTPGTTSVRLLVSQYNCTSNSSSSAVHWRAIPRTPTIVGNSSICNGSSVTLSAGNVTAAQNDAYMNIQWGTTSGGTQVSADAHSVTVSPTTTTTYYMRYQVLACGSPGTQYSYVASHTVTVVAPPTAPTGISGTTTICDGESTTLTATGGTSGGGASYQWFAGGCGSGAVLGTGSSISVSPSSTTTYYVRRVGNFPCGSTVTACASTTVTVQSNSVAPTSINAVVNP